MGDLDDIAAMLAGDMSSMALTSGPTAAASTGGGGGGVDLTSLAAEMSDDLSKVKGTPDVEVVSAEQVRTLVGLLGSAQASTVEEAAKAMSNLTLQDQNIPTILANGAVPPLVRHLDHADASIQLQAAWALSNIMIAEGGRTQAAAEGAAPKLAALLNHAMLPIQDRAVVAIAHLALDEAPRAAVAQLGVVGPISAFLGHADARVQENAAWALGNLLAYEPVQATVGADGAAVGALVRLCASAQVSVLDKAIRAVANLALLEQNAGKLVSAGAVPAVVKLMDHSNHDVKFNACRACNNLAIGDQAEAALNQAGAVQALCREIAGGNEALADQCIQALANLCMGTAASATARGAGAVPQIVKLLQSTNIRTRLNAARAAANIARDVDAANQLCSGGALAGLGKILDEDDLLKGPALTALQNFAAAGDGNKEAIAREPGVMAKVAGLVNSANGDVSGSAATVAAFVSIHGGDATHQTLRDAGVFAACMKACQGHAHDNTRLQAVCCLSNGAANASNMAVLGAQGALDAMLAALSDAQPAVKQNAAIGIMNYSGGKENQEAMRAKFDKLCAALRSADDVTRANLLKSLINFAADEPCRDAVRTAGGLNDVVNALTAGDRAVQEAACLAAFNLSFTPANRDQLKTLGAKEKAAALAASMDAAAKLEKQL